MRVLIDAMLDPDMSETLSTPTALTILALLDRPEVCALSQTVAVFNPSISLSFSLTHCVPPFVSQTRCLLRPRAELHRLLTIFTDIDSISDSASGAGDERESKCAAAHKVLDLPLPLCVCLFVISIDSDACMHA
jgi:hypothetical protein